MLLDYFKLAEPFGVTPAPRFLYLGMQHREALNPRLNDPNQIRVGQQILMPSAPMSPADGQNHPPQELSSSPQEVGKE